jgi:hypothetical protein
VNGLRADTPPFLPPAALRTTEDKPGARTLELYPITLVIMRHAPPSPPNMLNGGGTLGEKAKDTFGMRTVRARVHTRHTSTDWMKGTLWQSLVSSGGVPTTVYRRVPRLTATFSCVSTIEDVFSYLCKHLRLDPEAARLWLMVDSSVDDHLTDTNT